MAVAQTMDFWAKIQILHKNGFFLVLNKNLSRGRPPRNSEKGPYAMVERAERAKPPISNVEINP